MYLILIIYFFQILDNFKLCKKNIIRFVFLDNMADLLFLSKKEINDDKGIKKTNFWTEEEDKILKEKAKEFNYRNWNSIAEFIPGKSSIQCSSRYRRIRPGLIKGSWKKEEDSMLLSLFEKYGENWAAISKEMPHRTGKQIRDRFINSLDTRYKRGKFSEEEDKMILKYHKIYGNKWTKIAKKMKTRTGDMIKNRFYSSLKKEVIDKKNILRKKRKRSTSKYKSYPKENNSKIKAEEVSAENINSLTLEKKDEKNGIFSCSKEENSENTNDKSEKNYINNFKTYTKKLNVIIDNYINLIEN